METKRKRGRPKIENPRNKIVTVRLTDEDERMLEELSEIEGKDKSEIIRESMKNMIGNTKYNRKRDKRILVINTGQIFNSAKECNAVTNIPLPYIYACLRGDAKSYKGFKLKWVE